MVRWILKSYLRYCRCPHLTRSYFGSRAIAEKGLTALTEREHQIMRLVSEAPSNKEIARRPNFTDGTIKVHLHHIFQKLDVGNRTWLASARQPKNDNAEPSPGI
jgi:two-component system, NarL family, nitrate/nitrite response regulator NarL